MNERIQALRKALGMKQDEFGERLKLSRNYISKMEIGNRMPSDRTIADMAREFGANEHWLRTGEGEMFANNNALTLKAAELLGELAADDQNACRIRLIMVLAQTPPEDWKVIERCAEIVLGISKELDK